MDRDELDRSPISGSARSSSPAEERAPTRFGRGELLVVGRDRGVEPVALKESRQSKARWTTLAVGSVVKQDELRAQCVQILFEVRLELIGDPGVVGSTVVTVHLRPRVEHRRSKEPEVARARPAIE